MGQSFTQPEPQLSQRLQESRAPVVRDSWLSACIAAQARVPFGKHQVLPATWLEPPPATPTGSAGGRGQKRSLAGPPARQQQQQQGGALLPPPKRQHVDAAAAAADSSGAAAAAGSSQQAAAVAAVGGGMVTGADGTLALGAAVATQQVSGTAQLSSVTAVALRSYVAMRAWVPAVHCSSGGGAGTSGSDGLQQPEPSQRQSAEGGQVAPRASSQQQQVGWDLLSTRHQHQGELTALRWAYAGDSQLRSPKVQLLLLLLCAGAAAVQWWACVGQ